jgi:putative transcriptional regulator
MTIKKIRKLTGLSQSKFCEKYHIPPPTLRHWERGDRECPEYVLEMLEFKVRKDKVENMRKEFYDFHSAVLYQRELKKQGIESTIYNAYKWDEQAEIYAVVPNV